MFIILKGNCYVEFRTKELLMKCEKKVFYCKKRRIVCSKGKSFTSMKWKLKKNYYEFSENCIACMVNVPGLATKMDIKLWVENSIGIYCRQKIYEQQKSSEMENVEYLSSVRAEFVLKSEGGCNAFVRFNLDGKIMKENVNIDDVIAILNNFCFMGSDSKVCKLSAEIQRNIWKSVAEDYCNCELVQYSESKDERVYSEIRRGRGRGRGWRGRGRDRGRGWRGKGRERGRGKERGRMYSKMHYFRTANDDVVVEDAEIGEKDQF